MKLACTGRRYAPGLGACPNLPRCVTLPGARRLRARLPARERRGVCDGFLS